MKELLIESVRTDGGTQSRVKIDEAYVAELVEFVEAGVQLPPIDVFHDGTDYWCADGFHRVMAYSRLGRRTIMAHIRKGTKDDAVWASCGANAAHGLKRTNDDKRKAVEMALAAHPEFSDRAIAEHCKVSKQLPSNVRKGQVALNATCKTENKRTGLDGKQYSATHRPVSASKPRIPVPHTQPKPPAPEVRKDATGRPIPANLAPLFERGFEAKALIGDIDAVVGVLEAAAKAKDPLYAELDHAQARAALSTVIEAITATIPYAVCPWCGGLTMDTCRGCNKRGVVGKHRWDVVVPQELK